jgi:alpha-L-rhamnosidase
MPEYRLKYLDAEFASAAGVYKSNWKVVGESGIEVKITVPFGCEAELVLPYASPSVFEDSSNPMFRSVKDGVCLLEAGEYAAAYDAGRSLNFKRTFPESLR